MKKLLFILSMLIYSASNATTYYVSWSTGNDANNGTSTATAWKSVYEIATHTFAKGDSLLFKRGESWLNDGIGTSNDFALTLNVSGGSGVFYVGAYGTGAIPNIDGNKQLPDWQTSGNWELYATGIYRRLNFAIGTRLWLNGKEKKSAANLSLTDEYCWRNHTDGHFYVKAPSNPATYFNSMVYAPSRASLIMVNQSDIIIENLKIGGAKSFTVTNCKNITIQNCELFYKSAGNGIFISAENNDSTKNVIIRNNVFATADSMYYTYYKGNPNTGDAVWIGKGSVGVKVYNNYFDGWSHGAVVMYAEADYPFHNNEVYNNFITAPLIDYARGVAAYFYPNGYNNSIHDNTIYRITVQNQLNGHGLQFYNNVIDSVGGCPYPEKAGVGNGIAIEGSSTSATNMNIYNNTITRCNYSGIRIYGEAGDVIAKSGNNIHDNNVWNNGTDYHYQLIVFNAPTIINNTYQNNHFLKDGQTNTVSYRGVAYDISGFNSVTTVNGDVISGNDAVLKFGEYTTTVDDLRIEYNSTETSKIVNLEFPSIDENGTKYPATYTLQPYSSIILLKDPNPLQPASQKKPIRIDGKIIGIKSQNIIFGI